MDWKLELVAILPDARVRVLEGQSHVAAAEAPAPMWVDSLTN